jgi:hypothetical protein
MRVQCWLVNDTDLAISAESCSGEDVFVDAEAEVPLSSFLEMKGVKLTDSLLGNEPALSSNSRLNALASEIVSTIEIMIEEGVPRLLLNLEADGVASEEMQSLQKEASDGGYEDTFEEAESFEIDNSNDGKCILVSLIILLYLFSHFIF